MFSKSIFASKTFYASLLMPLVGWLITKYGLNVPPDVVSAVVDALSAAAVTMIGMRFTANGPVHVVTQVEASQDAPGATVVKSPTQAGYSRIGLLLPLIMLSGIAVFLTGCAAMSAPPAPKSIKQTVVYLESTAAIADQMAHQLYISKVISYSQEGDVLKASRAVTGAVALANSFIASGDSTSAQQQLTAVGDAVNTLTDFISAHPTSTP